MSCASSFFKALKLMLFPSVAWISLGLAASSGTLQGGWSYASPKEFAVTEEAGGIRIVAKGSGDLEIRKEVPVQPESRLIFQGKVTSTCGGHLSLQVKAVLPAKKYKGGSRFYPSVLDRTGSSVLRAETDSRCGTSAQLLIKVENARPGMSWLVSDAGLVEPGAEYSTPALEVTPGYASAGLFLHGLKAEDPKAFRSTVSFREEGKDNWTPAYPLDYQKLERQARGVLVNLKENTRYSARVEFENAGKTQTLETAFRTKGAPVPVAETIFITQKMIENGLVIDRSGTADGWLRYTAKPGTVLRSKGTDAIVMENVQYVILDGLTIEGGAQNCIRMLCCDHVQIVNCNLSRFGRVGEQKMQRHGWFYHKGKVLNSDAGIHVTTGSDILIERNFIHDPNGWTNPWFYSHPTGPKGINVNQVSEATVRYNDFIGGDFHRWNDAIESGDNKNAYGALYRNAEIYGNYFTLSNDDGIELEGGECNTRFFRNRIEGTLCGVSSGCCCRGPSFIFDNHFNFCGDQNGFGLIAFKNGSGDYGHGKVHFFHNSINGYYEGTCGVGNDYRFRLDKQVSQNNIFSVIRRVGGVNGLFRGFENRYDCDLFCPSMAGELAEWRKWKQELHGQEADDPGYRDAAAGDLRLKAESPAKGKGCFIPNFSSCSTPDVGAADWNQPYRPLPVSAEPAIVNFADEKAPAQVVRLTLTAPGKARSFRIEKTFEADWLAVSPVFGTVAYGKPVSLTVTPLPQKFTRARLNRTAFRVRFEDGCSRPVAVAVDTRNNLALLAENRRKVIPGEILSDTASEVVCRVKVPKTSDRFLMIFAAPGSGNCSIHVDGKLAWKGSFNGAYQVAGAKNATDPLWYVLADRSNRKSNAPFRFSEGAHEIRISAKKGKPQPGIKAVCLANTCDEIVPAAHRPELPAVK